MFCNCGGKFNGRGNRKTPVVERFTRELMAKGVRVAILSRGYKSKDEKTERKWYHLFSKGDFQPPKIVSDGKEVLLNSEEAGDEPYMLAKNLKGAVVLADKDRVKSGLFAIDKFKVNTLILMMVFNTCQLKVN